MKTYALTELQQASVAEMYNNGITPCEIAKEFDVSPDTVQTIRRKYGIAAQNKEQSEYAKIGGRGHRKIQSNVIVPKKRKHLSDDQKQMVAKLYGDGISPKKIGELYGVSLEYVLNIRRKFGLPAQNQKLSDGMKLYYDKKRSNHQLCISEEINDCIQNDEEESINDLNYPEDVYVDKNAAIIRFLKTVNSEIEFLIKVLTDET